MKGAARYRRPSQSLRSPDDKRSATNVAVRQVAAASGPGLDSPPAEMERGIRQRFPGGCSRVTKRQRSRFRCVADRADPGV